MIEYSCKYKMVQYIITVWQCMYILVHFSYTHWPFWLCIGGKLTKKVIWHIWKLPILLQVNTLFLKHKTWTFHQYWGVMQLFRWHNSKFQCMASTHLCPISWKWGKICLFAILCQICHQTWSYCCKTQPVWPFCTFQGITTLYMQY